MDVVFEVERIMVLSDAGHLKAFADVSVNNALVIRGLRVMDGRKGLFVSMPREQGKDQRWYDQVVCRDVAVFDRIAALVLEKYHQELTTAV